ncbi:MAG: hypothetical protein MUF15_09170 [Acidobacteria bacterium]|nr:hypothetical protein [Acidobacteriota bacterium]
MGFEKFINIIETDSLEMARKCAKGILESRFTKTYRKLPEDNLVQLVKNVYNNLAKWLFHNGSKIEVQKVYADIGIERYSEGYPLCEVLYAAHYEKKILADHISTSGLLPDALNLYHSLEFIIRIYDFFDIATFYLTRGYHEALYKKISHLKGLDEKKIKEIFPEGSFYYEKNSDLESFEKLLDGFNLFKVK